MRTIDVDALLEMLNHMVFTSDLTTTVAVEMAREWIEDAPTIDASPKWIPCKDRMPSDRKICLACGRRGGMRVVRYYDNGDWIVVGTGMHFFPVAWMELPEEYRGAAE